MLWKKVWRVVVVLMSLYLAYMYIKAGAAKLDPEGFWAAPFKRWGYPEWLRVGVGVLEILGGVMILTPWTATYGASLLIAVMVGAWVTRFNDGWITDVLWISIFILALLAIGYEWRGWRKPKLKRLSGEG